MNIEEYSVLKNMMPDIKRSVNRLCTKRWELDDYYNRHNLIFIYDGKAHFEENGETYEGGKGDLIYFCPKSQRKAYTYKNNLMKCYAVDFTFICPILNKNNKKWNCREVNLPFDLGQKINNTSLFNKLKKLFNLLNNIYISNKPYNDFQLKSVFLELMWNLILWKTQDGINYNNLNKIDTVIDYITQNYYKKVTLKELASLVNISASYLVTIFRDTTNKAPIEYLMDIRIAKSKQLLDDGYKVGECANQCGFNDVYYFSKYFKKQVGLTPTMYINRNLVVK